MPLAVCHDLASAGQPRHLLPAAGNSPPNFAPYTPSATTAAAAGCEGPASFLSVLSVSTCTELPFPALAAGPGLSSSLARRCWRGPANGCCLKMKNRFPTSLLTSFPSSLPTSLPLAFKGLPTSRPFAYGCPRKGVQPGAWTSLARCRWRGPCRLQNTFPSALPFAGKGISTAPSSTRLARLNSRAPPTAGLGWMVPASIHATGRATSDAVSWGIPDEAGLQDEELAAAKARLLLALDDVQRGAATDAEIRANIEEAQVNVESLGGGSSRLFSAGGLDKLHGLWRLKYSSASDVLGILRLPSLSPLPFPLLQVGDIYQNFICKGQSNSGIVQNIVDWSISGLLEDMEGARFVVTAEFAVASDSSLNLTFQDAAVERVRLSAVTQALLAPAFLPRTQISLQALQFFQSLKVSVPLQHSSAARGTSSRRAGGRYLLTFLDDNLLIGRATAPSGSFIFERAKAS